MRFDFYHFEKHPKMKKYSCLSTKTTFHFTFLKDPLLQKIFRILSKLQITWPHP